MKEVFNFFMSFKTDEEKEKAEKAPQELVAFLTLVVNDFSIAFKKAEPAGLFFVFVFCFFSLFSFSFLFFFCPKNSFLVVKPLFSSFFPL